MGTLWVDIMNKIIIGFVIVIFAVGGIEASITTQELIVSCVIAFIGLVMAQVGVIRMIENEVLNEAKGNEKLY